MELSNLEPCKLLTWDSEFFGCRIGRVNRDRLEMADIPRIDEWCRINRVRCLYFLARSNDIVTIRTAECNRFNLVDVRLTFRALVPEPRPATTVTLPPGINIRPAEAQDVPALQTLARNGHSGTRFFNDPEFLPDRVKDLYSTWIELDCRGRAQRVLVATSSLGLPVGYVSCVLNPDCSAAQIGLIGVDESVRGQGVGKSLVLASLEWFQNHSVTEAQVVTQGGNVAAQRLYQACGFKLNSLELWYHKWYA